MALHRFGFRPTVVERTEALRFGSGGHAVDLFDPALQIVEWMGVLSQVQDAGTHTEIISFMREGHRPVDVAAELMSEGVSRRHIEIMRGELAKIIYEAGRDDIEYVFGNSISSLDVSRATRKALAAIARMGQTEAVSPFATASSGAS